MTNRLIRLFLNFFVILILFSSLLFAAYYSWLSVFVLFIALGATPCCLYSQKRLINQETFDHENYGIILFNIRSNLPKTRGERVEWTLFKEDVKTRKRVFVIYQYYSWFDHLYSLQLNEDTLQIIALQTGIYSSWLDCLFGSFCNDTCRMIVLAPGIYTIDSMESTRNRDEDSFTYKFPGPGIDHNNRVVYGAFKVEARSVGYLGHLELDSTNSEKGYANLLGSPLITKADKLELVKWQLKRNNHLLADKLIPIEFFPADSILNLNSTSTPLLSPNSIKKEKIEQEISFGNNK